MSNVTSSPRAPGADQCVEMWGIGWKGYKRMLKIRGDRNVPRMTYLDGDVWLMSPSFFHESLAERLGTFVVEIAIGLRIPYLPAGQTTFRRLAKQGGVESDKSFYFANRARVRGKKRLHLQVDPPPDLVIEAVDTHDAEASLEVWQRFGVPEIWVCDEVKLRILIRQPDGTYSESDTSAIFPFLTKGEIHDWVTRSPEAEELDWGLELRRWIQDVLAPRVRGQGG